MGFVFDCTKEGFFLSENSGMHCRGPQLFHASIEAAGSCKDIGAKSGDCCWLKHIVNTSAAISFRSLLDFQMQVIKKCVQ
jgi:hypothetical protein